VSANLGGSKEQSKKRLTSATVSAISKHGEQSSTPTTERKPMRKRIIKITLQRSNVVLDALRNLCNEVPREQCCERWQEADAALAKATRSRITKMVNAVVLTIRETGISREFRVGDTISEKEAIMLAECRNLVVTTIEGAS
jgi:uncharacterized protein YaiL (DUF2058 family)